MQDFFFKAMLDGYVSNGKFSSLKEIKGYKSFSFSDNNYRLQDIYCVNIKSSKSAGFTTIYKNNNPIWIMNYGGYYQKNATSFLKKCLLESYLKKNFTGGRGPLVYIEDNLIYINQIEINDFTKFKGREEIFEISSGKSLGYHEYWGMSLG